MSGLDLEGISHALHIHPLYSSYKERLIACSNEEILAAITPLVELLRGQDSLKPVIVQRDERKGIAIWIPIEDEKEDGRS